MFPTIFQTTEILLKLTMHFIWLLVNGIISTLSAAVANNFRGNTNDMLESEEGRQGTSLQVTLITVI